MCPNCPLSGVWVWLGPGLLCLTFGIWAGFFYFAANKTGEFKGDEEEAKYSVFD